MGYDDPREEKRVTTTTEETVVPSEPVEQTVREVETVERTETVSPASNG